METYLVKHGEVFKMGGVLGLKLKKEKGCWYINCFFTPWI